MLLTALLRCFPGGAVSLRAMQETWLQSLAWEDPLEKGMATHSSILAGESPWTRGDCQATVHGVVKSRTRLSTVHSAL